jgi:PAS domain S-box-containing protein
MQAELDELELLQIAVAREADRYRALFDAAPVAFITTDAHGKVLDANAAASAYFQLEYRFLVGKPILNYVAPSERRRIRLWMLDLHRRGASGALSARLERRSGVPFDANITASTTDDEIWWAIVDVTAQRQAEENAWQLNRELESRVATQVAELQAVYDELPVGIAIVDRATRRVRGTNRRAREILRPWAGELPGLELELKGEAAALPLWRVDRALEGEQVSREVEQLRTPDGAEVTFELSATPLRDDDGLVVAAALTFDDLSERERRQLADAQFVENAAHQLRTPITAIGMSAAALEAGAKDDPDERERFLGHITRESDRMARLIDALLGLAHIQRGGGGAVLAVVPLAPLVDEVVAETTVRPGVRVEVECPTEVALVGDGPMLREAIANVFRNAAAHTAAGRIRISARLDGEHAVLEVADTGPGIPPDLRERIFERFFRADHGTRRGAGLGLAIAAEATRANRGRLELLDTGGGACFRFTLPGATLR